MDSSRRAVAAYWRTRLIDGVTSDEDKVAPVYKLEEICELLRTSDAGVVKEVADYLFKRIDHKSPIVKQKALRIIKYAVGKSGVDFRREVHRHSSVIRELFHYRGHPDPLKGDALNKAVRETAHEALSCIFATDDNSSSPTEGISNRIQGFGNKNYEMPVQEKKSFLSEVVDIGRASIEQGLNSISSAANSSRKSDIGSYRSPNLRRSLTNDRDIHVQDRYEGNSNTNTWGSSGLSSTASGRWNNDSTESATAVATNATAAQSHSGSKSREERLLETIVTSGGVRLQPTRDAIRAFLLETSKLNQLSMSHAIESKLQSNLWQVRMKAMCVLESILRKKDDEKFSVIQSYFSENRDHIVKCSDSPQVSLREKASKVLILLEGESSSATSHPGESSPEKNVQPAVPLPDLIDTGFSDGNGNESPQNTTSQNPTDSVSTSSLVDLIGDEPSSGAEPILSKNEGDPFADVSFHASDDGKHIDGVFSGLTIDDGKPNIEIKKSTSDHTPELLDIFGSEPESITVKSTPGKMEMHDLMSDLTTNGVSTENNQPGGASSVESILGHTTTFNKVDEHPAGNVLPIGVPSHQTIGISPNIQFPMDALQYAIPPNMTRDQNFTSQTMNYGAMGNFITQQQLLFQNLQGVNSGTSHVADGTYASPIPDIFHTSSSTTTTFQHKTMSSHPKKEETKAFDFISDHLSSARNTKRLL